MDGGSRRALIGLRFGFVTVLGSAIFTVANSSVSLAQSTPTDAVLPPVEVQTEAERPNLQCMAEKSNEPDVIRDDGVVCAS